jgi:hypothetical protein
MRAFRLGLSLVIPVVLVLGCAVKRPSERSIPPGAPTSPTRPIAPSRQIEPDFDSSQKERIARVQPLVDEAAGTHDLDPDLINGVIWVESRFQTKAKSPAGARGLMQLMPATAAALAREMETRRRMYDPEFNINAGTLYLAKLLGRYEGDETLALAAYNAGAGNVNKWMAKGGLPEHSVRYVQAVVDARARFQALRRGPEPRTNTMIAAVDKTPPKPEPQPQTAPVSEPPPSTPEPVAEAEPPEPTPPELPEEPVYEPPLAETPYPPDDEPAEGSPEADEDLPDEDLGPEIGMGLLPSVLD